VEKEELILQMLKEIKEELKDIKKECKERGTLCNGRIQHLETCQTKSEAVKENGKDNMGFYALLISLISGFLMILVNADKVFAIFK